MEINDETNDANERDEVKNLNWQEADQLAIYKRGRGVKLRSTAKQHQLSSQGGTWTHDLRISSPVPYPHCHAALFYHRVRNIKAKSVKRNWLAMVSGLF